MDVKNVLVEYTNDFKLSTCSGILFQNRWVLFPAGSIFLSLLETKDIKFSSLNIPTGQLREENHLGICAANTKIVLKSNANKLQFLPAKFVSCFSCKNIKASTDIPLVCGQYLDDEFKHVNNLLSLFIIVDVNINDDYNKINLLTAFDALLKQCCKEVKRGNHVSIESCLFGNRDFIASYCEGIICNSFGENNCYFISDASTAPGSEGAPIFQIDRNEIRVPVGMVVSTLNQSHGESTGLTLGVVLEPLLSQLVPEENSLGYIYSNPENSTLIRIIDSSLTQLFCGNGWGTAILVDKMNGIFITASHVVQSASTDPIILKWKDTQFPGSLIFRTNVDSAFDIAVIKCTSSNVAEMCALKYAIKSPLKGESVIVAGFPIFNTKNKMFPTVSKGSLSSCDPDIIQTSCCVLAGTSGGAVLRPNGELLGIVVCHTTVLHHNKIIVYPKINMSVPVTIFQQPLIEYCQSKDARVLQQLNCTDREVINKWRLFKSKL